MKKIYSFLIVSAIGASAFLSPSTVKAQALEQGNVSLDLYYGFGSLSKSFLKLITDNSTAKSSFLGPMGLKFEYMASDKIGVGAEFNYTSYNIEWNEVDSATSVNFNYKYTRTIVRIMPRFNIHFGSNENFDGYFGIAAGYRQAFNKWESNDPSYDGSTSGTLIPFAMRIALGGRYFFTDNFGIHMELGLGGGAMIHGGLSLKF